MTVLIRSLFFCAALSAANAATAQAVAPPNDQSTIVVTGKRNAERDMQEFVRALAPARPGAQLSRFEQPVCPLALGLPQIQRDSIAGRMRRVAKEVGIAVGGANCFPNVVVMITQDKKALLRELRRHYPDYFGQLSQQKIKKLAREPGPAVAWHLQGPPVSARGTELFFDPVLQTYVNQTTEAASRINAAARPQFEGAVVIVERNSLAGLTVTQLADYAAMRAFAASDPSRLAESAPPTILRILEAPMGSAVPLSLTEWDFGFLQGFYSAPRNLSASAQRSAIRRSMTKDIERRASQ